jgi:hypothetical protein
MEEWVVLADLLTPWLCGSCIDCDDRKEFFESCLSSLLLNGSLCSEATELLKVRPLSRPTMMVTRRPR